MRLSIAVAALALLAALPSPAGAVLFDFDNAPLYSPLPIDLTVGGITAHFAGCPYYNYSIQRADALGFTPAGFGGYCIYPSTVYLCDLYITFSQPMTDFSIMYAPEEYGCDDSAIMRVTAYLGGAYVGTNTTTAPVPGTWPTGTLTYSNAGGFDYVVIHYDQRPACTDYGPIFMADNMNVTPKVVSSVAGVNPEVGNVVSASPNPFAGHTTIRFRMAHDGAATVTIHDVQGSLVRSLVMGTHFQAGARELLWDGRDDRGREVASGVYMARVFADGRAASSRLVLLRGR